jgi:hypothetical protein
MDICKQLLEVVFGMLLDSQRSTRPQVEVRRSWQWTRRIGNGGCNVRLLSGQSLAGPILGAAGASKKAHGFWACLSDLLSLIRFPSRTHTVYSAYNALLAEPILG